MADEVQSPFTSPSSWDVLYLAGAPAPGLARVTPRQGLKVQRNAGPGIEGGSLVDQGVELTDFDVELRIMSDEDWSLLTKLVAFFLRRKGSKNAIAVAHPIFALYKCPAIYVTGWSGPTPPNADAPVVFTFTACRWVKPRPASVASAKVMAPFGNATFGAGATPGAKSASTSSKPSDTLPRIRTTPSG